MIVLLSSTRAQIDYIPASFKAYVLED